MENQSELTVTTSSDKEVNASLQHRVSELENALEMMILFSKRTKTNSVAMSNALKALKKD